MSPSLVQRFCLVCLFMGPAGFLMSGCTHAGGAPRFTAESVAAPKLVETNIEAPQPLVDRVDPVQATAGPVGAPQVTLTRDGAILTALLHNRTVEVAELGPEMDATYLDEARGAFDPALLSVLSTGKDVRQAYPSSSTSTTSFSSGGSSGGSALTLGSVLSLVQQAQRLQRSFEKARSTVENTETTADTRVTQLLPTGTEVFLSGAFSDRDTARALDLVEGTVTVGVVQPLLRGAGRDVNLAALRQARNTAARSEHVFRKTLLDTMQQVERAYWELVLSAQVLDIRQFGVELAGQLLLREQDLLSVGKAIQGDVLQAEAEQALRTADLAGAKASVRSANLRLVRLLNPEDAPGWDIQFAPAEAPQVAEVAHNAQASEELALRYRPELAQVRLELANLDLNVLRARDGMLPRVDVVGAYGRVSRGSERGDALNRLDSSDYDNYSIGLEMQTSLTNRTEKARYRRAKLAVTQGERIIADAEQAVAEEVRQAIVTVEEQWQRLQATSVAVNGQTEVVRITQGRREVGKATNLDVLLVQRDLIQANVDDAVARVRYIQALTDLYAAEGTLLERRGIVLEDWMKDNRDALEPLNARQE